MLHQIPEQIRNTLPEIPGRLHSLAITLYLLTGGDGYTMFEGADIIEDTMLADNEVCMKYIEDELKGKIPDDYAQPLGRIRWTDSD